MLVEPNLDRALLATALHPHYGLATSTLRFLPAGETAWCYQVTDERGGRWFLKLSRLGPLEPARTRFALQLGGALADLGLPVPRPRPTKAGELWCWLDGLRVALFEFIDGRPLPRAEPGRCRSGQPARPPGRRHPRGHPGAGGADPLRQHLRGLDEGLRACLAELMPDIGDTDELRAQARALVWPQRGILLGMQERVHTLGEVARAQPGERVLCHGDLIGDNLLADGGGRLSVVDWDAAVLAPRERDLALFAGQGFERFLDHYKGEAGSCDLDPDLVTFFLLRRNLDDLVDWLGGVLNTDRPDAQRRADLDGVRWCLSRWGVLAARIQHTRLVLARRHRPATT